MNFGRVKQLTSLAWYYSIGLLGLRGDDVLLTSFPKSGNTWIRFFLCNLISLQEWDGEHVTFPELDATMPELGVSNLLRSWPHDTIPRVVKTHKSRWPIFRGNRAILLVRDPRDVMVSYFHYERGKKKGRFRGEFSEFIRHPKFGFQAWCEHYVSWRANASVVLTYERLKSDDVGEFRRMLDAVDITVSDALIEQAAKRSRFEEMKKVEEKEGVRESEDHFEEDKQFMRKGTSGQWPEYFDEFDLEYTRSLLASNDIDRYEIPT